MIATLLLAIGCSYAIKPVSRDIYKLRAYAYSKKVVAGRDVSHIPIPTVINGSIKEEDVGPDLNVNEKDSVRPYTAALIELLNKGHKQQALNMVDNALAANPDDHVNLYNKAVVLHLIGRYEESLSCLDRVTKISPSYFQAYYLRSISLLVQGRLGDSFEAVKRLTSALPPSETDYYSTKGYLEADLASYEEALADFDREAASDPKSKPNSDKKAVVLAYMGRYGDALKTFDAAIKDSPKNDVLYADKGYVQVWAGKYNDVLSSFDTALKLIKEKDPKTMAHMGKGYALIMLSRYTEAKDELDKALAESKENRDALYLKAVALKYGGRDSGKSDAEETFNQLVKDDPYDLVALYAYAELGQREEMLRLMEDLVKLDPTLATRFKSDRDFSKYQTDKDFIKLLTVQTQNAGHFENKAVPANPQ